MFIPQKINVDLTVKRKSKKLIVQVAFATHSIHINILLILPDTGIYNICRPLQ